MFFNLALTFYLQAFVLHLFFLPKNPQLTFLCSGDSSIPIYLSPSALYTPILSHFKDDVKKNVIFCNIFISTATRSFILYLLFCQLLFYFHKNYINFFLRCLYSTTLRCPINIPAQKTYCLFRMRLNILY